MLSGDSKSAGAYRPPGARGTLASEAYKRDENGSYEPSTPMFKGGKPSQRYVPGASSVPGAPSSSGPEEKKKRVRSKRPMKDKDGEANGNGEVEPPVEEMKAVTVQENGTDEAVAKKLRNLAKKVSDGEVFSVDQLTRRVRSSRLSKSSRPSRSKGKILRSLRSRRLRQSNRSKTRSWPWVDQSEVRDSTVKGSRIDGILCLVAIRRRDHSLSTWTKLL